MVRVDAGQLEQLLINLIKNGLEASPDGMVKVSWSISGDDAIIDIDDDGPGIPDSDNLFVPFFTTKPGGNGIGLVLARQIIEAHGGRLELLNRKPMGCRARVRFRVDEDGGASES